MRCRGAARAFARGKTIFSHCLTIPHEIAYLAVQRVARRPATSIGARGATASSQNQFMTYPYYVGISKHSPPTIYHGQGLA